jgi:hypothetical protein
MRAFGLIVLVLAAEGCAIVANDDGPTNKQKSRVASGPEVFPNSVKYSDKGLKPATGRAGSAQVTARALLGREGKTELELTTGSLDSSETPLGSIVRTQLKTLDGSGEAAVLLTDGPKTGGFVRYTLAGLTRGQQLTIQANVTGIDDARTDVVTVVETVKRRPDLTVSSIGLPTNALPNSNVVIAADVGELNGDSGARADCVLSVDGVEADRASGIWIDAGGRASCVFVHNFPTPGTHSLAVSLVNVAPADDDGANNTATATLDVKTPIVPLATAWATKASEENWTSHYYSTWYFTPMMDSVAGAFESHSLSNSQFTTFDVSTPNRMSLPLTVSFSDQSDGVAFGSVADFVLSKSWESRYSDPATGNGFAYDCGIAYVTGNDWTIQACSGESLWNGSTSVITYVDVQRFGGDATFYSFRYGWAFGENLGPISNTWSRHAPRLRLGNRYSGTLTATDGVSSMSASGSVDLLPNVTSFVTPYACTPYWWPNGTVGRECRQGFSANNGRWGSNDSNGGPPKK